MTAPQGREHSQERSPAGRIALRRTLSLPLLVLYGLGSTIGAGIFVLIGEVAGTSGLQAPAAFLVAAVLAGTTALAFIEMSSRFPTSAGEAYYVREGLRHGGVALFTGLSVVLAGTVSSATISVGFVGYLHEFIAAPDWLAVIVVVGALGALAAWGILQSVTAAALVTVLEIGCLLAVAWAGRGALSALPERLPEMLPGADVQVWLGVLSGGVLAFFAFIGFEDMVNVAEEVKRPRRAMPVAIVVTLGVTAVLYVLVSTIAVLAAPLDALARAEAPMAVVYEHATGGAGSQAISAISIVSVLNGALIQVVMASRVLYGLAMQGALPEALAAVHPRTRTPIAATLAVVAIVLALALFVPLVTLARVASLLTLTVFGLVNLALLVLKRRGTPRPPSGVEVVTVPAWVPWLGVLVSAGFVLFQLAGFLGLVDGR